MEYKFPSEVLAVRRCHIKFEFFGGSIQLNHTSRYHQTSFEISDEHMNSWETQIYVEEFSEDPLDMQGFKDIISSATGGDTVQIYLQANGYAFSRNVHAEFEVILKNGQTLTLGPVAPEKKKDEED